MIPVEIGDPQHHEGLTLFPLFPAEPGPDRSWTLLRVINRGSEPVVILDGEQLIGAKQNRTTNRTILVAAGTDTPIPVSCMEQGRWRHQGRFMKHGGEYSPSRVRRHARRVEAEEAHRPHARAADGEESRDRPSAPSELLAMAQGQVWHSIRDSSRRARVASDTGALNEVYEGRRERLADTQRHFPPSPGQVGLLAFVEGRPAGLDVLPADVYPRIHERLVRAYVFEAMDAEAERAERAQRSRAERDRAGDNGVDDAPREPALSDADAFLAAVRAARRHPMVTAGRGTYATLAGDVVGGELAVAGDTVHLCAFPAD